MKKYKIAVAAILLAGSSLTFTSCIGSFALTHKVLNWNNQVGNKFVNELVFFAFWILPVYEVSALADVLVINSIEFWSGSNPMEASVKAIDTENGRYLIKCDGRGYDITCQATGRTTRLDFTEDTQTWSVKTSDGQEMPFMTFIDVNHVKMATPGGDWTTVELSDQGILAYRETATAALTACR